ncbi:transient receptor potential cation channel subfamily M member 2 isoform X2 [Carcharodon carcharias]|uniref:transient receptor potential cation channel subfamily M member 2 isoform X2 n=1 Tax=Carcharodon carcharias TaxID=13397 RepID=UPI001B7DD027|nr:transient receptor potential cation channel subfamily M member 2 isoform X2 [Carcharodon carcharias]
MCEGTTEVIGMCSSEEQNINQLYPLQAENFDQCKTMYNSDVLNTIKRSPSFIKTGQCSAKVIFKEQDHFRKWVHENLRKKECTYFAKRQTGSVCECGYSRDYHTKEAINLGCLQGEKWSSTKHLQHVPTDAFGDIAFEGQGQKIGKYVRVSNDTAPKTLYHLMTKYWRLNPPHLLISVTGGAKNFHLKPSLRFMFRRGLIKVAQSTGAWIITGGSFAGVMKHVGEAVRHCKMTSGCKGRQIVAIGIASWGIVHNRENLIGGEGSFPVDYYMDETNQGRLSCLDHNHTHFILVDDGTHGHYGVEISLRTKMEKYISKQRMGTEDVGIEIPIVCVVLEGGPGTLNTIHSAMDNGTPCVIVEGSGRVADVLANAAALPMAQITISFIQKQLRMFFAESYNTFSEQKIISWTKKIQDIVRMRELLTVFRAEKSRNDELDVAILQALLKASSLRGQQGQENLDHQLKLAVAWNRVDIAKSNIFTDDKQWKPSHLHQAMFAALVGDKPGFVELFLENGVNLREFLSSETLVRLYNNILPYTLLYKKLQKVVKGEKQPQISDRVDGKRNVVLLHHVSIVLQELLGEFTEPLYKQLQDVQERRKFTIPPIKVNVLPSTPQDMQSTYSKESEICKEEAEDPERDLFIWAILQKRKDLASIFWEQAMDSTDSSLVACKILKKMSSEENDIDLSEEMEELAQEYEDRAIGLYTECYRKHAKRAQKLLIRVSTTWGNTTCLRLALEAESQKFMALGGVQALLTKIWWGELSVDTNTWQVLLCLLLWPIIYSNLITFRRDEENRKKKLLSNSELNDNPPVNENLNLVHIGQHSISPTALLPHSDDQDSKPLSHWQQLKAFYTAPVVVFYWNVLAYFGFLWLFSYVLLIDFQSQPSGREYFLYFWLSTLVCEEIRQLFYDPGGFGFRRKALLYISSTWNRMDVAAILIFVVGLICRYFPTTFYQGRIILCLDFIIYCVRVMHIFTVSKTLGPKIIMVQMMMKDIFFFLFLLVLAIVAYGVAKQGILTHNEQRLAWIFQGVVYQPYRMIFGEIPADVSFSGFDLSQCTVNGTDPYKPKCPVHDSNSAPIFPEWLTITLLCLFLLFSNILLLNLLIAMFNYTFQLIQENTDKIWKFQRYPLIEEYYCRPPAPPPFIIFSHVFLLIEQMTKRKAKQKHNKFKKQLDDKEEAELLTWEAIIKENYLIKLKRNQSQSLNQQISCTMEKVDTVVEALDVNREGNKVEQRICRLEEQMMQSMRALNWIMNTLIEKDFGSRESAPALVISDSKNKEEEIEDEEKDLKPLHHVNARSMMYPDTNIERYPVPDEKVPWEVKFDGYTPPTYTAETAGDDHSTGLSKMKTAPKDGSQDRDAGPNTNAVDESLPQNPKGRTGLDGRGKLRYFGANHAMDPIITRFKRNSGNSATVKGCKKVLEFLVVQYPDEDWTLPAGVLQSGETFPKSMKIILNPKMLDMFQKLMKEAFEVYRGYVDDSRNTDNAWIETLALNFHLNDDNPFINSITNRGGSGTSRRMKIPLIMEGAVQQLSVQWQVVEQDVPVCVLYKEYLQKVTEIHDACF